MIEASIIEIENKIVKRKIFLNKKIGEFEGDF